MLDLFFAGFINGVKKTQKESWDAHEALNARKASDPDWSCRKWNG
jgi:hypothetical protein